MKRISVSAEPGQWLTPEQMGKRLQVSGRTIREWFHAGIIPAEVAVGRTYRFDFEKVREALAVETERTRARGAPEMCGVC